MFDVMKTSHVISKTFRVIRLSCGSRPRRVGSFAAHAFFGSAISRVGSFAAHPKATATTEWQTFKARKTLRLIAASLIGAGMFSLSSAQSPKSGEPSARAIKPTTGLPAWVAALPLNEWHAIPNTSLSANLPNQPYIDAGLLAVGGRATQYGMKGSLSGYSGAALRKKGSWLLLHGGGGAGGWAGNDWVGLHLNTAIPKWSVIVKPSPATAVWDNNTYGNAGTRAAQEVVAIDQGGAAGSLVLQASSGAALATVPLRRPAAIRNKTDYSLNLPVSGTFIASGTVSRVVIKDSNGIIVGYPRLGPSVLNLSTTTAVAGNPVSVVSSVIVSGPHQYMRDGRPNAQHSYRHPIFNDVADTMLLFGTFNVWEVDSGQWHDIQMAYWNSGQYELDASRRPASPPADCYDGNLSEERPLFKHPDTDDVFEMTSKGICKWTAATNTWAILINNRADYSRGTGFIDPVHNLIFWTNGKTPWTFNLANNSFEATIVSGAEAMNFAGARGGGIAWEPNLKKLLAYEHSGKIFTISYAGFSEGRHTWVIDKLPMVNEASHPAPRTGSSSVWSKFQYVPELNGVVLIDDKDSNAYFIRTARQQ